MPWRQGSLVVICSEGHDQYGAGVRTGGRRNTEGAARGIVRMPRPTDECGGWRRCIPAERDILRLGRQARLNGEVDRDAKFNGGIQESLGEEVPAMAAKAGGPADRVLESLRGHFEAVDGPGAVRMVGEGDGPLGVPS